MVTWDGLKNLSAVFGAVIGLVTVYRLFAHRLRVNATGRFAEVEPYPRSLDEATQYRETLRSLRYDISGDEWTLERAKAELDALKAGDLNNPMFKRFQGFPSLPPLPSSIFGEYGVGAALKRHTQWTFIIRNSGGKEIKDLTLHAPYTGVCKITHGGAVVIKPFEQQVAIPTMRSRDTATVRLWTENGYVSADRKQIRVSHADGSVQVTPDRILHGFQSKLFGWIIDWWIPIAFGLTAFCIFYPSQHKAATPAPTTIPATTK